MGTTTSSVLAQKEYSALDQSSPVGYIKLFPIKNIVFTEPTVTLLSKAYGYVIGGYNNKSLAWLWHIPQ